MEPFLTSGVIFHISCDNQMCKNARNNLKLLITTYGVTIELSQFLALVKLKEQRAARAKLFELKPRHVMVTDVTFTSIKQQYKLELLGPLMAESKNNV